MSEPGSKDGTSNPLDERGRLPEVKVAPQGAVLLTPLARAPSPVDLARFDTAASSDDGAEARLTPANDGVGTPAKEAATESPSLSSTAASAIPSLSAPKHPVVVPPLHSPVSQHTPADAAVSPSGIDSDGDFVEQVGFHPTSPRDCIISHGTIVFTNHDNRRARFVRIRTASQASAVLTWMKATWKNEWAEPDLLLTGTGSSLEFVMSPRAQSAFSRAFSALCSETRALVMTSGTNIGVSKLLGEAFHSARVRVPLLGVAPYGQIYRREAFQLNTEVLYATSDSKTNALCPYYSYFILVGDKDTPWAGEIPFRTNLEEAITTRLSIPRAVISVAGNKGTLFALWSNVLSSPLLIVRHVTAASQLAAVAPECGISDVIAMLWEARDAKRKKKQQTEVAGSRLDDDADIMDADISQVWGNEAVARRLFNTILDRTGERDIDKLWKMAEDIVDYGAVTILDLREYMGMSSHLYAGPPSSQPTSAHAGSAAAEKAYNKALKRRNPARDLRVGSLLLHNSRFFDSFLGAVLRFPFENLPPDRMLQFAIERNATRALHTVLRTSAPPWTLDMFEKALWLAANHDIDEMFRLLTDEGARVASLDAKCWQQLFAEMETLSDDAAFGGSLLEQVALSMRVRASASRLATRARNPRLGKFRKRKHGSSMLKLPTRAFTPKPSMDSSWEAATAPRPAGMPLPFLARRLGSSAEGEGEGEGENSAGTTKVHPVYGRPVAKTPEQHSAPTLEAKAGDGAAGDDASPNPVASSPARAGTWSVNPGSGSRSPNTTSRRTTLRPAVSLWLGNGNKQMSGSIEGGGIVQAGGGSPYGSSPYGSDSSTKLLQWQARSLLAARYSKTAALRKAINQQRLDDASFAGLSTPLLLHELEDAADDDDDDDEARDMATPLMPSAGAGTESDPRKWAPKTMKKLARHKHRELQRELQKKEQKRGPRLMGRAPVGMGVEDDRKRSVLDTPTSNIMHMPRKVVYKFETGLMRFLWAIIHQNHRVALLMWRETAFPIRAALLAVQMYRWVAKSTADAETSKRYATKYERIAATTLTHAFSITQRNVSREATALAGALREEANAGSGAPVGVSGRLTSRSAPGLAQPAKPSWWASLGCGRWWCCRSRKSGLLPALPSTGDVNLRGVGLSTTNELRHRAFDLLLSPPDPEYMFLAKKLVKPFARAAHKEFSAMHTSGVVDLAVAAKAKQFASHPLTQSVLQEMWVHGRENDASCFAPKTLFFAHLLFYCGFIALHTALALGDKQDDRSLSAWEIVFYVANLGFFAWMCRVKTLKKSLLLAVSTHVIVMAVFVMRVLYVADLVAKNVSETAWDTLAMALIPSSMDLLNLFANVIPNVGPLVIIIRRILSRDIVSFAVIAASAAFAYGAAYAAIFLRHTAGTGDQSLGDFFWALLGDWTLPLEFGDNEELGSVLLSLYLVFLTLISINLLIAMMSDTYSKVRGNSTIEWQYVKAQRILIYSARRMVPPPLDIVVILYHFGRLAVKAVVDYRRSTPHPSPTGTPAERLPPEKNTDSRMRSSWWNGSSNVRYVAKSLVASQHLNSLDSRL